jgi:hypothetical protein
LTGAAMKRSAHVALLVMATTAVGGTAYSLMPSEDCTPPGQGGVANPPAAATTCSSSSHGRSSSYGSSRRSWSFFSGDSATEGGSHTSSAAGTQRGGFGAFARSIGAHVASFGG